MSIGVKIRRLREANNLTQPELAFRLGIAQTTLCNIESGDTKKIDFLLMDKVCKEFKLDFQYFMEDKQVNKVKKIEGSINNYGTINLSPENLLDQLKLLIDDNKQKEDKIQNLEIIIARHKK